MGGDSFALKRWLLRLFAASGAPGQDRSNFDFRAPVGTVIAPQTQILNILPAALSAAVDPQTPREVRLAPTLVNRGPQEAAVRERLDALHRQPGTLPPLLVVLPGRATDCHEAFVTRFALRDLKRFVRQDAGYYFTSRLPWPTGYKDVSAVLCTLRDGLGLPTTFDQQAMETWLTTMPASICFSHYVDRGDWETDTGALIKSWVDYLCHTWPPNSDGNLVVAFLSVEMPASQSLTDYLVELRERSQSTLRLVVTPDMEPIRPKHIEEWIGVCCRELRYESMDLYLHPALLRLLAEPERLERPLYEVYAELVIILRDVMKSVAGSQPLVTR